MTKATKKYIHFYKVMPPYGALTYSNRPYLPTGLARGIAHVGNNYQAYSRMGRSAVKYASKMYDNYQKRTKTGRKTPKQTSQGGGNGGGTSMYSSRTGMVNVKATSKRKRGRGSKVSLKKRISALEKDKDPQSYYTNHRVVPYKLKMSAGQSQEKGIYWIPGVSTLDINSDLASVDFPSGSVDMTFVNTQVRTSCHTQIIMKNAGLGSVIIKYVELHCDDSTNVTPINELKTAAIARGITFANLTQAAVAASSTSAALPLRQHLNATEAHYEILSKSYNSGAASHWKNKGPVKTMVLNPGDRFSIYAGKKQFRYEPEEKTLGGQTYIKSYDYGVLIQSIGEIAHDVASDVKIGRDDYFLDCIKYDTVTYKIDNGLGLRVVSNNSQMIIAAANWVQAGANNVTQ